MVINPNIDNLRVVCCHDTDMLTKTPSNYGVSQQAANVNTARVESNLDAMARTLANKSDTSEAWSTIFRSGKPWPSSLVAIKVNTINTSNVPGIAVIGKICQVFRDLGVPASSIIIYDACTNSNNSNPSVYNNYSTQLRGVKIDNDVAVRLRENYSNIVAIKDATGGVDSITDLRSRCDIGLDIKLSFNL